MCMCTCMRSSTRTHINGPITPFDWVVDGWRCCAGDAIGGRAVTRNGKGGGEGSSRRRKGVRVPLGGKRRWCNGVGGCMNRLIDRESEGERW